jgi:anaerobic ribonucleoside-triphosphate reductase activating protein
MVRAAGMTVMAYSGFEYEALLSEAVSDARLLLDSCDLLLDGPYLKDLPTQRPWRGSDNQRLIALSPRYAGLVDEWNEPTGQSFEIHVRDDGTLEVLGIPPASLAAECQAAVLVTRAIGKGR